MGNTLFHTAGMPFRLMVLAGVALFAAFVNGAIGYEFSSLTVPLALVFYTNRILNPAVVVIEVFLNLYVLFRSRRCQRKASLFFPITVVCPTEGGSHSVPPRRAIFDSTCGG